LFQLVLSQGKKEFLVEDEFELLGHYLEIQKMRFNDKLKYEINLEDSIKKYFLPKLIIQPFVENSIEHGFVNKTTECNIIITGKEKDSMMEFEIIDTGSGMTDEKIKELLSGKETSRHERIGSYAIKNIIDRLKLLYRDNHVFEIESIIGRGTKVKIIIPKERNLK
jgi:two-component system sensor histidine kinase YesM